MSTATSTTKCHSCEVEESVLNGTASREDRNHWSMWGCTCTDDASANAEAFIDMVTR